MTGNTGTTEEDTMAASMVTDEELPAAARSLAVGRFVVGLSGWLAPRMLSRLFGVRLDDNPEAVLMARLFGVRDVALGVAVLGTTGQARQLMLRIGVACDLLDALAAVVGTRGGGLPKRSALLLVLAALSAAGLGAQSTLAEPATNGDRR